MVFAIATDQRCLVSFWAGRPGSQVPISHLPYCVIVFVRDQLVKAFQKRRNSPLKVFGVRLPLASSTLFQSSGQQADERQQNDEQGKRTGRRFANRTTDSLPKREPRPAPAERTDLEDAIKVCRIPLVTDLPSQIR